MGQYTVLAPDTSPDQSKEEIKDDTKETDSDEGSVRKVAQEPEVEDKKEEDSKD